MTPQEFTKLRQWQLTVQRRFRPTNSYIPSRRKSKSQKTGTGQVLRHSRVIPQVGLNRQFTYTWGY
jgi:hypothetical protein